MLLILFTSARVFFCTCHPFGVHRMDSVPRWCSPLPVGAPIACVCFWRAERANRLRKIQCVVLSRDLRILAFCILHSAVEGVCEYLLIFGGFLACPIFASALASCRLLQFRASARFCERSFWISILKAPIIAMFYRRHYRLPMRSAAPLRTGTRSACACL